jgi:hypothetical protein
VLTVITPEDDFTAAFVEGFVAVFVEGFAALFAEGFAAVFAGGLAFAVEGLRLCAAASGAQRAKTQSVSANQKARDVRHTRTLVTSLLT